MLAGITWIQPLSSQLQLFDSFPFLRLFFVLSISFFFFLFYQFSFFLFIFPLVFFVLYLTDPPLFFLYFFFCRSMFLLCLCFLLCLLYPPKIFIFFPFILHFSPLSHSPVHTNPHTLFYINTHALFTLFHSLANQHTFFLSPPPYSHCFFTHTHPHSHSLVLTFICSFLSTFAPARFCRWYTSS